MTPQLLAWHLGAGGNGEEGKEEGKRMNMHRLPSVFQTLSTELYIYFFM